MNVERDPVTDLIAAFESLCPRIAHLIAEARAAEDERTVTALRDGALPNIDKAIAMLNASGVEVVPKLHERYIHFDNVLRELEEAVYGSPSIRTMFVLPDGRYIEKAAATRTFRVVGQRIPGFEVDGVRYRVKDDEAMVSPCGIDDRQERMLRLVEIDPTN